jgi:hypothetical protein
MRRHSMPADQDLPFALMIREDGDEDTYLATVETEGDSLLLELDDGRTITLDRRELLARA